MQKYQELDFNTDIRRKNKSEFTTLQFIEFILQNKYVDLQYSICTELNYISLGLYCNEKEVFVFQLIYKPEQNVMAVQLGKNIKLYLPSLVITDFIEIFNIYTKSYQANNQTKISYTECLVCALLQIDGYANCENHKQ